MGDESGIHRIVKVNNDLQKLLNKIAVDEGFIVFDIDTKTLNSEGNNYFGILNEATIKGTTNRGEEEMNIFVKSSLPDKDNLDIVSMTEAYDRERYAYMEIAKVYEKLQKDAQIPPQERYKFPKCYEESNSQFIIMENLSKKGFTTRNRLEVIPLEFAEICIKQLAKFHAISYAIEKHLPNYFNEKIKVLKLPFKFNEQWDLFFAKSTESSLSYLEGNAKERLKRALPQLTANFKGKFSGKQSKMFCLCHGDYRISNLLQKIQCDEVSELIPVDYQMIHYGTPMLDFIYFIFGASDSKFRRNHLDYLKNMYFDTMAGFLKYFSIEIEDVLPRNEFDSNFREYLDIGLVMSLWYYHFNLADEDDLPDLTKIDSMKLSCSNQRIESRLTDVVNDFIDWGYL